MVCEPVEPLPECKFKRGNVDVVGGIDGSDCFFDDHRNGDGR